MSILLHKGQKCPKNCPHGLLMKVTILQFKDHKSFSAWLKQFAIIFLKKTAFSKFYAQPRERSARKISTKIRWCAGHVLRRCGIAEFGSHSQHRLNFHLRKNLVTLLRGHQNHSLGLSTVLDGNDVENATLIPPWKEGSCTGPAKTQTYTQTVIT